MSYYDRLVEILTNKTKVEEREICWRIESRYENKKKKMLCTKEKSARE